MSIAEVEACGRVVTVRWDGSRRNALSRSRYAALAQAARAVSSDQVLVLRSSGPTFCAGQDLDEFTQARAEGRAAEELKHGASAIVSVLRCAGPVVVLAQGAAIGAGALLVTAADVPIVAEGASLRLPELELGLPLGASVAERLLPAPLVRRMLYTGERVDAGVLAEAGAVRMTPPEALEATGEEVIGSLLSLDTSAFGVARGLWDADARAVTARAYEREVEECVRLLESVNDAR